MFSSGAMKRGKATPQLFPDSDEEDDGDKTREFGHGNGGGKLDSLRSNKGSGSGFQINKNYAERYDKWRTKEELMKVKARFGTTDVKELEAGSDESSSSEEEEWTEENEKAFFKTLSVLKQKDPRIYDPNARFFTSSEENQDNSKPSSSSSSKKVKSNKKPFLLKDHERTMVLEKGALVSDSDSDDETRQEKERRTQTLSYNQEQAKIKQSFTEALKSMDSDDDEEGEESTLLKKGKGKTAEENQQDEEDYRRWLKGELERIEHGKLSKDDAKELSFLRSYWSNDKLDEGEVFLRDYILNKKYVEVGEKGNKADDGPSSSKADPTAHDSDEGGLSDDEKFEEQREEFEHKYNFRFEEPDPEFIKRFPRTVEDSLRREDERRKLYRQTAKDRKKETIDNKREEVNRLKALKRKEILDKLRQIQEITGDQDLPLEDLDLDGDFDPEEYDKKMKSVFSDQFYNEDGDSEKPQFPHDPEIDDEINWDEWQGQEETVSKEVDESHGESTSSKKKKRPQQSEQEKTVGDLDEQKNIRQELIRLSKGKKKGRQSKFLEVLEKEKPKFDPTIHKSFQEYFDEYYALDFEDVVGDMPCRFKYRKVVPNNFGLTTKEILDGDDRELNQWASLKKTYQYRTAEEEKFETQAYEKKSQNEQLKKRLLLSLYQQSEAKNATEQDGGGSSVDLAEQGSSGTPQTKKKKKKKQKKNAKQTLDNDDESSNTGLLTSIKPEPADDDGSDAGLLTSIKTETGDFVSLQDEGNKDSSTITSVTADSSAKKKKKKRKKKNKNTTSLQSNGETFAPNVSKPEESESKQVSNKDKRKEKQKNRKRKSGGDASGVGLDDDRLQAYGLNPKKFKKWEKYGGSSVKPS